MAVINKFLEDMDIISKLGDNPGADNGLSSRDLRAKFDEAGKKIQQYLNNVIVPGISEAGVLFAPAGYGLGDDSKYVSDLNHAVNNGWYYSNPSTLNIPAGMTKYADIFVKTRVDAVAQYIRSVTDNTSLVRYREDSNSEYIVEWDNPPMMLGEKYRTTKRYNGQAVYTRLIGGEAVVNGGKISTEIESGGLLISASAVAGTMLAPFGSSGSSWYFDIDADTNAITTYCGASVAGKPVYITIEFVE